MYLFSCQSRLCPSFSRLAQMLRKQTSHYLISDVEYSERYAGGQLLDVAIFQRHWRWLIAKTDTSC